MKKTFLLEITNNDGGASDYFDHWVNDEISKIKKGTYDTNEAVKYAIDMLVKDGLDQMVINVNYYGDAVYFMLRLYEFGCVDEGFVNHIRDFSGMYEDQDNTWYTFSC